MSIWRQSLLGADEMRAIAERLPTLTLDEMAAEITGLGWGFSVGNSFEGEVFAPEVGVMILPRYGDNAVADEDWFDGECDGPIVERLRGAFARALKTGTWGQAEWEKNERDEREFEAREQRAKVTA